MSELKPEVWTTRGLLDQFCEINRQMEDRSFAFILGAGASVPSNIDSGGKLVEKWLAELKRRHSHSDAQPMAEWATDANLGIEGFDYANAERFYPQVFERRFRGHQEEGYAYLEMVMEGKEPSIGYSVLAKILAETRHRVVITTNFDNLVADALAIYTQKHPLVAGHESLSGFVRSRLRRPLVAKIHRDLFLAPINNGEVDSLKEGWELALKKLFEHYTPIVVGYGGNDGSLMELLRKLPEGSIPGGIFWCHRKGKSPTDERILEVITRQHGKLVPIIGFDEFMLELGGRLEYPPMEEELVQQGKARVQRYRDQFEAIQKRIEEDKNSDDEDATDLKQAFNATVERQKLNWWGWQLRINEENDAEEKERLYREALKALPQSAELTGNFANFMKDFYQDYDEAERLYLDALKFDPNHANNTGNFASFMKDVRKDYDEAERLYLRALELEPNNAINTGNFAIFMTDVRKEFGEAERLYLRALELAPEDCINTGNLATFMHHIRKDYDEAESLYRRALALEPRNADTCVNFSAFLIERGVLDEAREYAKRAASYETAPTQAQAEGLLYLALIEQLSGGDDTAVLNRLKGLLVAGYQRGNWDFAPLFEAIADRLSREVLTFYRLICDAILNEDAVAELEQQPRWQELVATPPK